MAKEIRSQNPWLAASNEALLTEVVNMNPPYGAVIETQTVSSSGTVRRQGDRVYFGAPVCTKPEDTLGYLLSGPEDIMVNPNASSIVAALGQRLVDMYTPPQTPEGGSIHG